jgi:nucleotide-binding universal stress UspA family protein
MSGRIVVGVDGSQGARAALEWAVAEARLRGDTVEVVHAWHAPPHMIPGPYAGPAAAGEEAIDRPREQAEHLLEHQVRAVDTHGVEIESRLRNSNSPRP